MSKFSNYKDTYSSERREAYKNRYGYYPDEDSSLNPYTIVPIVLPEDVAHGDVVEVGDMIGVAMEAGSAGQTKNVATTGTHPIDKGAEAISEGTLLYWNGNTAGSASEEGRDTLLGVAASAASAEDAKVSVRLNGTFA